MMEDCRNLGFHHLLGRSMSSSEVRMAPRPPKAGNWSTTNASSLMDDGSSCSDNASDNSDKIEMICSHQSYSRNRKRKIGNNNSSSFNTSGGNGTTEEHKDIQGQNPHGAGSLWAEAESLAADFDGSLSGLGADLSTASYDMSEALLALPSIYHHHRNAAAQQMSNSAAGFIKEAGLTPLSAAHLHGGSSVSLPGDFHYENHASPSCQQMSGAGTSQMGLDCERRFQYVLAAATSIATKVNEESLTYLNQGQPYEIKLKKLGDLTSYRGMVFRTVVRLCFHDRRLQFSEREQIVQWEDAHPNDKILQVDLPLSYGMTILPPTSYSPTNTVSFLWEPLKEVGIYVKVNCISTEFTPKKHGGEKGVPFRMLIETYSHPDNVRLHAGACQVKVFKLKGGDRKHKQDREKILKKTPGEQAKLQPSYECTVLTDISLESLDSPPPTATNNQTHSILAPTYSEHQNGGDSPEHPNTRMNDAAVANSNCNSSSSNYNYFSAHYSPESVRKWLSRNRFAATKTLWDFSGLDLLRLSKEELTEMCGLPEGIRLFNALHYKITFYVTLNNVNDSYRELKNGCTDPNIFHPVCLSSPSVAELTSVLGSVFSTNFHSDNLLAERMYLSVNAPGHVKIRVNLTDQLLSTLKDQTAFKAIKNGVEICLEILE